ncbi:hypothetical protein [Leisingera sp. JC1]|uniref:hypothetical protein n=1 Tax=Leisingera sp. JC1 TaxID=1855282 RepID=UPI0008033533|nr:hypothetical protein [Leisingera sp. JC1]OBY28536.1 hypothetical protein A9D60_10845 [Leisingera sp. JC1]
MLRTMPMFDPETRKQVVIEADDETLEKICNEVSQSSLAMSALYKGHQEIVASRLKGDISSPTPPAEYLLLYQIMNKHDQRFAGTLGSQIIRHLEQKLIKTAD